MFKQGSDGQGGADAVASTGIAGLDAILRGGFPVGEIHVVQGRAGTGKTTLALQFLLQGAAEGEAVLYLTASQTRRELERIARSHGWSLEGISIHELPPMGAHTGSSVAEQTVLHTSDLELGEVVQSLRAVLAALNPRRVVLDSAAPILMLTGTKSRYHLEVTRLREMLVATGATSILLADGDAAASEEDGTALHPIASSGLELDQLAPEYGGVRRRIIVRKMRGVAFRNGYHDFQIKTGGLQVYPRITPDYTAECTDLGTIASGIAALDELLGGGLERGSACVVVGPPGVGKSTLSSVFAHSGAAEGIKAAIFLFDERPETYKSRAKALGIDFGSAIESGKIVIQQLDAAKISAGEFSHKAWLAVEEGARIVIIDSLTGYFNALGNTPMLCVQMHDLLTFLSRKGVLTILLVAQQGFASVGSSEQVDVSYLSDTILVMRMFEAKGEVRRCITALKKRQGEHQTTIREVLIGPGKVDVGAQPLRQFRNLLTGQPKVQHEE